MFGTVLPATTQASLAVLSKLAEIQQSYLAGGTALALQFGHRESDDLDFFTQHEFEPQVLVEFFQRQMADFKLERTAWGTILGYIGKVKFSLFYLKYPLLRETHEWQGIRIADVVDIAAMKIAALSDRSTKRDFTDLFFLLKQFSLDEMFNFYDQKYGIWEQQQFHILRALVYFDEAELGDMPRMLKEVEWKQIREKVSQSVQGYMKGQKIMG